MYYFSAEGSVFSVGAGFTQAVACASLTRGRCRFALYALFRHLGWRGSCACSAMVLR